jgi:hypothetical protein
MVSHPNLQIKERKRSPMITIRTTGTTTPSGSIIEASFDPTTISDKHLFDLHGAISKESTRRWKKVIKEGSRVERLKQEKNNILEGCREAVRLHEGIEQISEAHNPLEGFKELIDRMIKTNTDYQQQVVALKKEKEEVEQQRDLAIKEIQTTQEKMDTALETK